MRNRQALPSLVFAMLLCAQAQDAGAQMWGADLQLSTAYMPYMPAGQTATLLVVPDGTGPSFADARLVTGAHVNSTIRLTVLDAGGVPIAQFPRELWWLEWQDGGVDACRSSCCGDHPAGLFCDRWTGANGSTEWQLPPYAGGHSETRVLVCWLGMPLQSNAGLRLRVNSPDINGDLAVNLMDAALFAGDYFGNYAFRSDLSYDGVLNLSDISVLAQYWGAACYW